MPLVYDELHRMAERQMSGQPVGHTLSATALVHESYLKLVRQSARAWKDRAHFLAVAAVAMRHVLVNHAERRKADKRGGGRLPATLDEGFLGDDGARVDDLLALDRALDRLDALSPRQRAVVECRFFGGLTWEEIAEAVEVSVPTVRRDWRVARAWLARELAGEEESG
jgi:RNA polymerase sigma factor (TIGR02999 family)